jgi:hypothetical protein
MVIKARPLAPQNANPQSYASSPAITNRNHSGYVIRQRRHTFLTVEIALPLLRFKQAPYKISYGRDITTVVTIGLLFFEENTMSSENQGGNRGGSHEQHGKAREESHKKESSSSSSSKKDSSKQSGSTRGGTSEQHAEAGRQSHKNDR